MFQGISIFSGAGKRVSCPPPPMFPGIRIFSAKLSTKFAQDIKLINTWFAVLNYYVLAYESNAVYEVKVHDVILSATAHKTPHWNAVFTVWLVQAREH